MSTPNAPPPAPADVNKIVKSKKPPLPPLELTPEEMAVINKWTGVYEKTTTSKDRLELLSQKILPRLTPLNTHLTKDAWRVRKSVSSLKSSKLSELKFNEILASQTVVPEQLPSAKCPCPVVHDPESVPQAGCLPCIQGRDC